MTQELAATHQASEPSVEPVDWELRNIHIGLIDPDPRQPRTRFNQEKLEKLAESLKETRGPLQPLLVRPSENGRFILTGGERRWRAMQLAGLTIVPCMVRRGDKTFFLMSLIENEHRADLDPIDQALAFKRCHEEYGMSYFEIARIVGLRQRTVENRIQLLDLPPEIQEMVREGTLPKVTALGLSQYAATRDIIQMAYDLAAGRDPEVALPKRKTIYKKGEPRPTEFREYFYLGKESEHIRKLADALLAQDPTVQRVAWQKNHQPNRDRLRLALRDILGGVQQIIERLDALENATPTFSEIEEDSPARRPHPAPGPPSPPPNKITSAKWPPLPDQSGFENLAEAIRLVSFSGAGGRVAYLSEERLSRKGVSPEFLLDALRVFRAQWRREPATGETKAEREFLGFLKATRENSQADHFFAFIKRLRDLDTSEDPVPLSPLSDDYD